MDDPAHNTNGGTADHTSVPLSQTNSEGGMEQLPVQNTNGDTANHISVPLNLGFTSLPSLSCAPLLPPLTRRGTSAWALQDDELGGGGQQAQRRARLRCGSQNSRLPLHHGFAPLSAGRTRISARSCHSGERGEEAAFARERATTAVVRLDLTIAGFDVTAAPGRVKVGQGKVLLLLAGMLVVPRARVTEGHRPLTNAGRLASLSTAQSVLASSILSSSESKSTSSTCSISSFGQINSVAISSNSQQLLPFFFLGKNELQLQPPFSIRFFEISPFSASAIRKERGGNSGRNRHHEEGATVEGIDTMRRRLCRNQDCIILLHINLIPCFN